MPRIDPIEVDDATGKAKQLLDEMIGRGIQPGPMALTMANAPVLLRAFMDLDRTMKRTHLEPRVRERIGLAVQRQTGCEYCLASHTRWAQALDLDDEEIELALQGTAGDPKIAAIVAFSRKVAAAPREITDEEFDNLLELGYTIEQVGEVVAFVALQLMTGAFNIIAGTQQRG